MRQIRCCLSPYCTGAGNEKYFRIPKVKDGPISHITDITKDLNRRRRLLWLKVLGLTESALDSKNIFVCSRHFISGKPAYESFEDDVDWVPTVRIPVPKIVFIPPPTEEHSYCQTSIRNLNVQKEKLSVRHTSSGTRRRCSRRLPIVKKKKEKAIERAAKAQQLADDHRKKIEEKRKRKKKLEIKKAKKLEKLRRAEIEAIHLGKAGENSVNPGQLHNMDLKTPCVKLNREPKSVSLLTTPSTEKTNTLGNGSIASTSSEANVFKAPVSISAALGSMQKVRLSEGLPQQQMTSGISGLNSKDSLASQTAPFPLDSRKMFSFAAKVASKNQVLKGLALTQMLPNPNPTYIGKPLPLQTTQKIINNDALQLPTGPVKIIPSQIKAFVMGNDQNPLKALQPIIVKDPSEIPQRHANHVPQIEFLKPSPQSGQFMQNLRHVQDYVHNLMLKKNPTDDDTSLSFRLLNLIEHRQNMLATEPPGSTVPILRRTDSNLQTPTYLSNTGHSCEYILPDVNVSDICSSCGRQSSSAYVDFLKSQLEQKLNSLELCTKQLENVKKELSEAKEHIHNLSAQLQENTLTLCSYLAANPPKTLKKEK